MVIEFVPSSLSLSKSQIYSNTSTSSISSISDNGGNTLEKKWYLFLSTQQSSWYKDRKWLNAYFLILSKDVNYELPSGNISLDILRVSITFIYLWKNKVLWSKLEAISFHIWTSKNLLHKNFPQNILFLFKVALLHWDCGP